MELPLPHSNRKSCAYKNPSGKIGDGTFHGRIELPLDRKVDMVLKQLMSGDAVVVWDLNTQTGSVVLKKELKN